MCQASQHSRPETRCHPHPRLAPLLKAGTPLTASLDSTRRRSQPVSPKAWPSCELYFQSTCLPRHPIPGRQQPAPPRDPTNHDDPPRSLQALQRRVSCHTTHRTVQFRSSQLHRMGSRSATPLQPCRLFGPALHAEPIPHRNGTAASRTRSRRAIWRWFRSQETIGRRGG
jgi:hypothetical protein